MAVAKEYLFETNERSIGKFGKAIGHAARVRLISALLNGSVMSYSALHELIPLGKSAFNKHLRILEANDLIYRDSLSSGLAGYRLNMRSYVEYLGTIRAEFQTTSRLRNMALEVREGGVGA